MPLPQWHASLRPRCRGRTTSLTLFEVSSLRGRSIVSRSGVPPRCWIVCRSLLFGPPFHGLSTPEGQQLSIRGEDLSHGILELASLLNQRADLLHPFLGNALDALLAIRHERQRPGGMPLSLRAPAVGFPATAMSQGQRAGQSVFRNMKAAQQGVLPLTQARSGVSFGVVPVPHLGVIIHQDYPLSRRLFHWGNLRDATPRRSSIATWRYRLGPELLLGDHASSNRMFSDHPPSKLSLEPTQNGP